MTVTALDTALPCLLCYLLDCDDSAQVPHSAQPLMAMLRLAPLFLSFSLTTQSSVYWSMSLSQLDLEPLLVCKACFYPIEGIYAVFCLFVCLFCPMFGLEPVARSFLLRWLLRGHSLDTHTVFCLQGREWLCL